MTTASRYWLSWYHKPALMGGFELHLPWWISGTRADGADTVCAAVIAASEDAAREIIFDCYDKRPFDIEWRFCDERAADWSPFSERFPRADWMQWPEARS